MATRNIVPRANGEGGIGTAEKHWGAGHFDELPNWQEYLSESTGYGIVSGCTPTISGLTVTVAAGLVHLAGGTRKEIASTNITLDAADASNPRIDLVYIDSTGVVAKVTGTAAASPSVPTLPSNGISVCNVTIAAGTTTGTVTDSRDMLSRWYNTGVVNVKDFGAKGDGVTDDTAAIQAAFNVIGNNGGGVVLFPPATYHLTTAIMYDGGNLTIIGNGAVLEHTVAGSSTLNITGGTTSYVTDGAITVGDTTISMVSTDGINAGDICYIQAEGTDALWCKERNYYYKGEFVKVISVTASSIEIATPAIDSYITGASVVKLNDNDVKISGLKIARNNNSGCLNISNIANVILENCKIEGANERCFYIDHCYNVSLNSCTAFAKMYDGGGTNYGLCLGSCQNVSVIGGYYRAGRHGITTGGQIPCRFCTFTGCIVDAEVSYGFDFHANIQFATITGVISYKGFSLAGINIDVSNCISHMDTGYGFLISAVRDSGNSFSVSNVDIIHSGTNSAFCLTSMGSDETYDINVGNINISNVNIIQDAAITSDAIMYFAGSTTHKLKYKTLNIDSVNVQSNVAQETTKYTLLIGGNGSTLNDDADINISKSSFDGRCRAFCVPYGNIKANINFAMCQFITNLSSTDHAARFGTATFNFTDCVFDGKSIANYLECTGGSLTFNNCIFKGMTDCAVYGTDLTYMAAFNCKNLMRKQFYYQSGTSPDMITGINSLNNARVIGAFNPPNTGYWSLAEIAINRSPVAGGYIGWVCTANGTPGTWKGFGLIES
jgi:hypothetical protein